MGAPSRRRMRPWALRRIAGFARSRRRSSRSSSAPRHGDDQRQLEPLEVAVNLAEASVAQPSELLAEAGEAIFGVVLHTPDRTAKALVQPRCRWGHQIEVRKDAARREQ